MDCASFYSHIHSTMSLTWFSKLLKISKSWFCHGTCTTQQRNQERSQRSQEILQM